VKLYRNLTGAVVDNLHEIFEEGRYADKVIEKSLKQNSRWGARDRRFIAEVTYDIVRWFRLLQFLTDGKIDYWMITGAWFISQDISLPAWQEFEGLDPAHVKARLVRARTIRNVRESVPEWLDTLGANALGANWERELTALNKQAEVVLRVNTLKTDRTTLASQLAAAEVETSTDARFADALILARRQNVFLLPSFKEGLFEVQDAGSQLIAPFLDVQQGMRVIDACAGAGGKSLHLAALMHNKGRLLSLDVEQWKLDELKKRARRAGAGNIETRLIEGSKTIKRLEATADRVLLDVPCSGLGVLRRNPDAKWKLSADFIAEVQKTQQTILQDYSKMVRPGGKLVYSTCSILQDENETRIRNFLGTGAPFELEDQHTILPSEGFDGFYMARLVKK